MNKNLDFPFKPAPKLEYIFFGAIFFYLSFHGYVNYLLNPNEWTIGYADYTAWSRPLDDLLQGKIFARDFYYYYGPLFALLQTPFYYLFGANHWALLINYYIVMPLLSLILAHLYIRVFIDTPWLRIVFLIVCLFHFVIGHYPSPRHLCAELTLALFFFCLTQPEKKIWWFLTGIMQGVSILFGTEYGVALFIAISGTFILFAISNNKVHATSLAGTFLLGLLASLTPFILYMISHGALLGFLTDYYIQITSFGRQEQPGSNALFPPFPSISISNFLNSTSEAITSKALRMYLPIIFYGIAGVIFLVKFFRKQNPACFKYFLLTFFGITIFYRGWESPAYGIVAHGVIPAITLGFLFLEKLWLCTSHHYKNYNRETGYKQSTLISYSVCSTILVFIITWFFLTIQNKHLFTLNSGKIKSPEMVYYDKVGFKISKEAHDQYTMINNYIEQNVRPDEYILSYPWGYYSQFTGRTYALTSHDVAYGVVTERQRKRAVNELKSNKPKLILINRVNSGAQIGAVRGDAANQISWRTENSPLFLGNGNPIQIYILENYHLEKSFKYAHILKRNKKRKPFDRTFKTTHLDSQKIKEVNLQGVEPLNNSSQFKIKNRKIRIEYNLKEPQYATHVELKFSVHQASHKKLLSRSMLRLGIIDSQGKKVLGGPTTNNIGDLRRIKTKLEATGVPLKIFLKKVSTVWIELETPKPYLLPQEFHVISLKFLLDERIKLD